MLTLLQCLPNPEYEHHILELLMGLKEITCGSKVLVSAECLAHGKPSVTSDFSIWYVFAVARSKP